MATGRNGLDGVLDELDGRIVVRCEWVKYTEPTLVKQWWPLYPDALTLEGARERGLLGLEARHEPGGGAFSIWDPHWRRTMRLMLPQGGQTKAVKIEHVPISPPKTRLPTRWREGKWEKETKRGWVPA